MKTISKIPVLCLLLTIFSKTNAQVAIASRPDLFSSYSSIISAPVSELDRAFNLQSGSAVQLNFGDNFSFTGTVISSLKRYQNLSSVLIKSTVFKNALLSISKRTNPDNSITYIGRIINEKYADGYQLIEDNSGNYSFTKIKTTDLIQDY